MSKIKDDIKMLSEILNKLIEIENSFDIDDEREKEIFIILSEASYEVSRAIRVIDKYNYEQKKG